jgi:hypothetical protein
MLQVTAGEMGRDGLLNPILIDHQPYGQPATLISH